MLGFSTAKKSPVFGLALEWMFVQTEKQSVGGETPQSDTLQCHYHKATKREALLKLNLPFDVSIIQSLFELKRRRNIRLCRLGNFSKNHSNSRQE